VIVDKTVYLIITQKEAWRLRFVIAITRKRESTAVNADISV